MMPKSPNKNLKAIIEKAPGTRDFWLFDLKNFIVEGDLDLNGAARLLRSDVVVLQDAKGFLTDMSITPHADMRLMCLSTIKKLVGKSIHESLRSPSWSHAPEAVNWLKAVLPGCLQSIEDKGFSALVALECQVIPAAIAMERRGLPFDGARWQEELARIEGECQDLKDRLHDRLGSDEGFLLFGRKAIDLNNASAVKRSLERILGRAIAGTSRSALSDIDHDVVKDLFLYRESCRFLSVYGQSFLERVVDGRLRGSFVPIGSASGRFACRDPNLLALPREEIFQACLRPEHPYVIAKLDYNAFELRILASLSGDKAMLKIFESGLDIHSRVAHAIFGQEVSKTSNAHLRDRAKVLNFGIIYGMGEQALAKSLGAPIAEAKDLMNKYFTRFNGVRDYLLSLEEMARERGLVRTALGRCLRFTEDQDRGQVARVARNMPIQGTGADIIKLALCKIYKELERHRFDAYIINLVHDEIVIESEKGIAPEVADLAKKAMEEAYASVLSVGRAEVSIK